MGTDWHRPARLPRASLRLHASASSHSATSSSSTTARSTCSTATSIAELKDDPGYKALMKLPGVGKVIAAIFVAEIGDVTRFDCAKKLCSWAGLTPKHRESDEVGPPWRDHQARITARAVGGDRSRRQLPGQAATRSCAPTTVRIAERRGKYKARVAVARKLLTLVYYGLRDGEVRCLEAPKAA